MAAFSSQHYPLLLDSDFLPNTNIADTTLREISVAAVTNKASAIEKQKQDFLSTMMSSLLEEEAFASCFPYYPFDALPEIAVATATHEESSCFGNDRKLDSSNEGFVVKKQNQESPSTTMMSSLLEERDISASCFPYYPPHALPEIAVATTHEKSSCFGNNKKLDKEKQKQELPLFGKKRKNRDGCCLNSAQPKDIKEGKGKKTKKCSTSLKEAGEKKPKEGKTQKKACEEPPTGYIHVRARRGQATDSHSLAERVRREKISERMKFLQGLVPGCDKVTGKALVLDEIINYVQSMQKQVEFLSMKLASVDPIFFNFGVVLSDYMHESERLTGIPSPSTQQSMHNQAPTFTTTNNYPLLDGSASFLLHEQMSNPFSQDNGDLVWDVKDLDQRVKFLNQAGYDNTPSFQ